MIGSPASIRRRRVLYQKWDSKAERDGQRSRGDSPVTERKLWRLDLPDHFPTQFDPPPLHSLRLDRAFIALGRIIKLPSLFPTQLVPETIPAFLPKDDQPPLPPLPLVLTQFRAQQVTPFLER